MSQAPDVQSKPPDIDVRFRDRTEWRSGSFIWQSLVALIAIEVAFVAGVFMHASLGFQRYQGEMTVVLVTMATLCLGFGIGVLVCWRYRDSDEDALREKYKSLHHRAELLVEMAGKLERKKERR